jgi:uncharacterized protein (TIGR00255 family)
MTGHGDAHCEGNGLRVSVDIRTVNSRYFKMSLRGNDYLGDLESRIDPLVRKSIRRGTVNILLQLDRDIGADDYRINDAVLAGYLQQLSNLNADFPAAGNVSIDTILTLPGVIETNSPSKDTDTAWKTIEPAMEMALDNLQTMRRAEGQAMADDLLKNIEEISGAMSKVRNRAPQVVSAYQDRLTERMTKLLADYEVTVTPADVVREVGIFSERSDISEELVRSQSHLEQFQKIMNSGESAGRKLDFLVQEMVRETNTIGSKANDAEIAQHVVEIKTAIERLREMVQNIE